MEDKRIVEINGVKVEVDMRTAKRVDQFRVGDAVKVLVKDYGSYASYFGMIVGFDEFRALPTLIVAYLKSSNWESDPLKLVYINAETKDVEICPHDPHDIGVERGDILTQFDRSITRKEEEIKDLQRKKKYFAEMFGRYFKNS